MENGNKSGAQRNLHRVRQIEGVCEKVHKGTVRVVGSVTVLVTDLLMCKRVETQCLGSTWKKYHPDRLEKADSVALLVGGLRLNSDTLYVVANRAIIFK